MVENLFRDPKIMLYNTQFNYHKLPVIPFKGKNWGGWGRKFVWTWTVTPFNWFSSPWYYGWESEFIWELKIGEFTSREPSRLLLHLLLLSYSTVVILHLSLFKGRVHAIYTNVQLKGFNEVADFIIYRHLYNIQTKNGCENKLFSKGSDKILDSRKKY